MIGHVILVGAGPGDIGLLTLRGAQAIKDAQVVVYDRLVGADILALMPESAEKINVGKASSNHLMKQEDINMVLVNKALEGKTVVRLKGGDCYLFGRGGEEVEVLREHNISFEVIPGVTSSLSVPAYAGIPVTHRDFCSSIHIVTAHARAGASLEIDFDSLVKMNGTIVFMMGVTALPMLMKGLQDAGMDKNTAVGVIENGTRYNQRKIISTLENMADEAVKNKLKSPAVIIVGEVVTLSDKLDWFSQQPLHNKKIVVTRPKERIGTLSNKLRAFGAGVVEYPCISTIETPENAKNIDFSKFEWIVLTSPAGINAMKNALETQGLDMRAVYNKKFACIGSATAKELSILGIKADVVPDTFDAVHLGDSLVENVTQNERVVLLRADKGTKDLTDKLELNGIEYVDVGTYVTEFASEQSEVLAQEINDGLVDMVTFTSASTVIGFINSTPNVDVSKFTAICIGNSTAKKAKEYNMNIKIAKNATIDDMVNLILEEI